MFTMTSSNVYGANQINGAKAEAEKLGYKLKVYENTFSQPEQDQQVQQYIASGAKPAAIIWWPWVARRGPEQRPPAGAARARGPDDPAARRAVSGLT